MMKEFYNASTPLDPRARDIFHIKATSVPYIDNSPIIAKFPIPKQSHDSNLRSSIFYIEDEQHDWLAASYNGYALMSYEFNDYLVPMVGEEHRETIYHGQDCAGILSNKYFGFGLDYGSVSPNTAYLFLALLKYGAASLNGTKLNKTVNIVSSDTLRINMLRFVNAVENKSTEDIENAMAEFGAFSKRFAVYNSLYSKSIGRSDTSEGLPYVLSGDLLSTSALRNFINKTAAVLEITPKTSAQEIRDFVGNSTKILTAEVRYNTEYKIFARNKIPRILHAAVFIDTIQNQSGELGLVSLSMNQESTPLVSEYSVNLYPNDLYALPLSGIISYELYAPRYKEKARYGTQFLLKMQ